MKQPDKESLLDFPCDFSIKAMGLNNKNFELKVVEIILRHVHDIRENSVRSRPSKEEKYISITVTIQATSKKQLDAIYQDLYDSDTVLMTL